MSDRFTDPERQKVHHRVRLELARERVRNASMHLEWTSGHDERARAQSHYEAAIRHLDEVERSGL